MILTATSKGGSGIWGTNEFGGRSTGLKKMRKDEVVLRFGDGTRLSKATIGGAFPRRFAETLQ